MATSWFSRVGSDPVDPSAYTKLPGLPTCSTGSNLICAIFADVDSGNVPIIDSTLVVEMVHALDSRTDTATVKLKL